MNFIRKNPEKILKILESVSAIFFVLLWLGLSAYGILFMSQSSEYQNDFHTDFYSISRTGVKYYFPDTFWSNEPFKVRAIIDINRDVYLTEEDSVALKDIIRVSQLVKIELIDKTLKDNTTLKVEPVTNSEQLIDTSLEGKNVWEWRVTPKESGEYILAFKSTNLIHTNEGLKNLDNPIYEKTINVKNHFYYKVKLFFKDYWFIILVVLSICIGLFIYIRAKRYLKQSKVILINEFMAFELKIRNLVQEGKIEKVFEVFNAFISSNKLNEYIDTLNIFEASYTNSKTSFNTNLITYEEYNRYLSKTIKGVLDLINEVKDKHTTQRPL